MRYLRTLPAAALLTLALTSCSQPKSGTVTDRDFTRAYMGAGHSQSTGKTTIWIPGTYHPDHWELRLRKGSDEGWRDVTETEYRLCTVGESYPDCAAQ